ncbi:MAG TPA: D-amino acid aminotransferase [Gammaproteobacteria bacterium]|nr:D-amino acid aminotransferase [Gammaproteobacteria bacterium]
MAVVYLNGTYLPPEQATVPVTDRGFIFGDGVYELIPVYGGRLFRLDEHLARLEHSLAGARIQNPMDRPAWRHCLEELVRRNGSGDLSLYLQITRGAAPRDHAFPARTPPTVFASAEALKPVPRKWREQGVAAVTLADSRWTHCHLKTIALLPNILLRQQAVERGAVEAILIRDGQVTEGAASNVFAVIEGEIRTPPKGPLLLPGITRDVVLELAAAEGLPHRETALPATDLQRATEIWLTSSTREIVPVTTLDGIAVGRGRPGPLWRALSAAFEHFKENQRRRGD